LAAGMSNAIDFMEGVGEIGDSRCGHRDRVQRTDYRMM
jgi:hypothetical protein